MKATALRGAVFRTALFRTALFWATAFLGAFLLFAVQPMFGKWLLPALGGSPATWSLCMVSFQLLLLTGYALTYWGATRLSLRAHAVVQVGLLVTAGIVTLRLCAFAAAAPISGPLEVPELLLARVGLPFIALACTTPLLSRLAAGANSVEADREGAADVHHLYAVSNAGSLLGLLSYPFLIERLTDLPTQMDGWAKAFIVFALLMGASCWIAANDPPAIANPVTQASVAEKSPVIFWFLCACIPSAMLLAATNHITVDIAATPLLWVLPLTLYLLSFVITFWRWPVGVRGITLLIWVAAIIGLSLNAFAQGAAVLWQQVTITLVALFSGCLLCHGALAAARPAPAELPRYYLVIASGGAVGGAFVSLLAPLIFTDYYELEISAAAVFVVLLFALRRGELPKGEGASWPKWQRRMLWLGAGLGLPLLGGSLSVRLERETQHGHVVTRLRSFLGPLRVVDVSGQRLLIHGRIQHGMQLLDPKLKDVPTMYFGQGTALSRVMHSLDPARPTNIGVVGLGAGTIASYGRTGDEFRFYELDANVIAAARDQFTFLADSAAHIDVVLGDGRISLRNESAPPFDVLVLDAFSSDSVPVHLLTQEAFQIYLQHLRSEGLLLANVSNRHLAVDRVVRESARVSNLACVVIESPTNAANYVTHVQWAVMARSAERLNALFAGEGSTAAAASSGVLWTDAQASVFSIVRR